MKIWKKPPVLRQKKLVPAFFLLSTIGIFFSYRCLLLFHTEFSHVDVMKMDTTEAQQTLMAEAQRTLIVEAFTVRKPSYLSTEHNTIHVAIVVCGGRLLEGLLSIKSIWLSCPLCRLHFYIFTDSREKSTAVTARLNFWQSEQPSFEFTVKEAVFLDERWRTLFRPCASLRLFVHDFINSTEWLLYMDSDTVAVDSLQPLWDMRSQFGTSHIIGAAVETYLPSTYSPKLLNSTPYVEPAGINSGVLLMNLARIRRMPWLELISKYYDEYGDKLRFGDQCILNAMFHFQPDLLFLLPPSWNLRSDFCTQCSALKSVESCQRTRPRILHGNRQLFQPINMAGNEHQVIAKLYRKVAQAVAKGHGGKSVSSLVDNIEYYCFAGVM